MGGGGGVALPSLAAEAVDVPTGVTVKISAHTLATDFNLSGGTLEFDIASGGKAEYTGTVTGSGTIEKTGDGWLTFNGGETLTADSTLKASGGRFRFRDAAAAGDATFVGNGGFFGNVEGSVLTIPETTVVTGGDLEVYDDDKLRFYVEGAGTNVIVRNCSRLHGSVKVYGDSLASVVKFDGQVPMDSETTYHYVAAHSGTVLLASEHNGFDYFQTIWNGGLGALMFGSSSASLIGDVSMKKQGRIDMGGVSVKVKGLSAYDVVQSPMDVVITNSAAADGVLTVRKGDTSADSRYYPRYVVRDGETGRVAVDYAVETGLCNLDNVIYQNSALTVSCGALASAARLNDFNRPLYFTSPGVSGRYLRLVVTNSVVGTARDFWGMLRIAEFRLMQGGRPVAWPDGTTATSPNAPKQENRDAQAMIDGAMGTFWQPADYCPGKSPATNVVDMTREVAFNGYQMAAGLSHVEGDNTSAYAPTAWTLEVGRIVNGEIVWTQVADGRPSEKIGESSPSNLDYWSQMYYSLEKYYQDCIMPLNATANAAAFQGPQFQNSDFALAVNAPGSFSLTDHQESVASLSGDGALSLNGSRLFVANAADFTGALTVDATSFVGGGSTLAVNGTLTVGNAEATETVETDALDDTALVSVGERGRLALRQARETVGGLAGAGTVDLGGGALTLAEPVESGFSGAFTGGGTLTWADGTFRGAATAEGDYTVRLTGGRWAGRLDVSGALTLDGRLVVDASGMEYGRHTLFTFGSLGAGSEAVVAAVANPKPKKPFRARVSVEGNAVVLDVYAPLMLIIR